MPEPGIQLGGFLLQVLRALWRPLRRLVTLRSAGRSSSQALPDFSSLDQAFDQILASLAKRTADLPLWKQLLVNVRHYFLTPAQLRREGVRIWLQDSQVQASLRQLALARLLGQEEHPEGRQWLQHVYSRITGEREDLGTAPVDGVISFLTSAISADMQPGERHVAALIMEGSRQSRSQLRSMRGAAGLLGPQSLALELLTKQAKEQLSTIRKSRTLEPNDARRAVLRLAQRAQAEDLQLAAPEFRGEIFYWAARLHATESESLEQANAFLAQLEEVNPYASVEIITALMLDTVGNTEEALRALRDIESPDARAVFFSLLVKSQGPNSALDWLEKHINTLDPQSLTGPGWFSVAVALAQSERWEEASDLLASVEVLTPEWPDLAYLEGVVNAALLLPRELRKNALEMNLLHPTIRTLEGAEADQRRERALLCFRRAQELLIHVHKGRSEAAARWLLWLRLSSTDDRVRADARNEVEEGMKAGREAISFLPLALTFGISFDQERLWTYLQKRAGLGGLEDYEIAAKLRLVERAMTPREFFHYLEAEESELQRIVPLPVLSGMKVEALAADNQTSKARQLLEAQRNLLDQDDARRLAALIDSAEGNDPREQLEALYRDSHELLDLKNLVLHLRSVEDWAALRPLLEELFGAERTLENAKRLVHCMDHDRGGGSVELLGFLERNGDLTARDPELLAVKAWSLFKLGRLEEASQVNNLLLGSRTHPGDLHLDINLALQEGNWERFPTIVEREWTRRQDHDPETLLRLATLAAVDTTTSGRAIDLVRLAAHKGNDDPQVLVNAIGLSYRLGSEDEETARWLSEAVSLSTDAGPVRPIELRTVVEEWMPAHRERMDAIEQHWLRGEIPVHMVASEVNLPLCHFFVRLPQENARQRDGRQRTLIPIFSGQREPVDVQARWRLGLDISSLMMLSYLGLLDDVIAAFPKVVIAPDTLVLLLNERTQAEFHQPSLIKKAEEILELVERGVLRLDDALPAPSPQLTGEVGAELASLLEAAATTGSFVIRPRPIYRVSTFVGEEAHLGHYREVVLSTKAFERLLHRRGCISESDHEAATRYLEAREPDINFEDDADVTATHFYLDGLALYHLQGAGLIDALSRSGLDLRVSPSLRQQQGELMARNRDGHQLLIALDEIRLPLYNAFQSGRLEFVTRQELGEKEKEFYAISPTLAQFLQDSAPCDAICIDDRFLNAKPRFTDRRGKAVPLLCTLDLIRHLRERGALDRENSVHIHHRLREAGFGMVPVDHEQLDHLFRSVAWEERGSFVEGHELRIIRQALARMRSLRCVQIPSEATFLSRLRASSLSALRDLWGNRSITVEHAVYLSDWIWEHVVPSPMAWASSSEEDFEALTDAFIHHLAFLVNLTVTLPDERKEAFNGWVEGRVLQPLLAANGNLVDRLSGAIGRLIEDWSIRLANQ